ncbi:MAG: glycoside hydrolase family 5 protein [Treponema sp.]|nr:glycoside hydrolase family 5 protein [Treponema sp.]
MKYFWTVLLIFLILSCPIDTSTEFEEDEPEIAELTAMEFASSMKIGWNVGNSLDANSRSPSGTFNISNWPYTVEPNETRWGNPRITQSLMYAVAAQGFDNVRIPVTWGSKIGPAPDYIIDYAWLNRVEEVVEYVLKAGMKAIINIHHDGADSYSWLSVRTQHLSGKIKDDMDDKFIAVWNQIAVKFIDTSYDLLFESFNELHDGSWGNGNAAQHARVNELNQIFVDTVRETGGKNSSRFLVIPGWVTRPSVTVTSLVMPEDSAADKIFVAIHYYDPYDFSGDASWNTWGQKSNTITGPGGNSWANESHVRTQFNNVKTRFTDNGIPVILGEYGAVRQSSATGKAHRLYYMEYVTKHAVDCGFIPIYWDNGGSNAGGEGFGLFNRLTNALLSDAAGVIAVMMKAAKENYSLSDIEAP